MNIESSIKEFIKYVKTFDLTEQQIMSKFHHTFRVIEYSKEIAKSEQFNKNDLDVCVLISLLHDIARFKQWTKYKTYRDDISVDHGSWGVEILKENNFIDKFISDKEIQKVILKAIYNHNKLEINLENEKEILFTKLIRDADKIDIILELEHQINSDEPILKEELVKSILNKKMCQNHLVITDEDRIIRTIGFVFDLNFKKSYEILLDKKIIENKFNVLEIYFPNNENILKMKETVINYMKGKC